MKQIICTINKDTGELSVKTVGYKGKECLEATKKLEEGLGMDGKTELTPEYHQTAVTNQQKIGGGA